MKRHEVGSARHVAGQLLASRINPGKVLPLGFSRSRHDLVSFIGGCRIQTSCLGFGTRMLVGFVNHC